MKIELIKLKFNDTHSYKYKPFTRCCDKIQSDKAIVFTGEDLVCNDTFGLVVRDSDDNIIPQFCTHILKHLTLGEMNLNRQIIIQSSSVLIVEKRLRF